MKTIVACLVALSLSVSSLSADTRVWINEFNYAFTGTGEQEFVEIVVNLNDNNPGFTGGLNLADVRVDLYDGATGMSYAGTTLNLLPETSDDQARYFVWNTTMEDGNPDGISLAVGSGATASQFISYGGSFTATNGPANGQNSVDVGFFDGPGDNLSIGLIGSGEMLESFSWMGPLTATPGAINSGQNIPEPASGLLLATAVAGFCMTRRRRQSGV